MATIAVLLTAIVALSACQARQAATASALLINRERASRNLPGLKWNEELAAKANAWAQKMADQEVISHSVLPDGVSVGWHTLGENVGWGSDVQSVHQQFMLSPVHREAILNGAYTSVGVGVAERDGNVYVAEVFRG